MDNDLFPFLLHAQYQDVPKIHDTQSGMPSLSYIILFGITTSNASKKSQLIYGCDSLLCHDFNLYF